MSKDQLRRHAEEAEAEAIKVSDILLFSFNVGENTNATGPFFRQRT